MSWTIIIIRNSHQKLKNAYLLDTVEKVRHKPYNPTRHNVIISHNVKFNETGNTSEVGGFDNHDNIQDDNITTIPSCPMNEK